jgi:hypothetical protein
MWTTYISREFTSGFHLYSYRGYDFDASFKLELLPNYLNSNLKKKMCNDDMTGSEPNHWNQRYLINKKKKIGSIGSWPRSRATNTSTWNNSVRQLHLIKMEGVILVRPPAKVEISKARSSLHSEWWFPMDKQIPTQIEWIYRTNNSVHIRCEPAHLNKLCYT